MSASDDAMEPRLLRSFVAVAEELHFGRAARRLHLSQPPLSVHIRTLEERLGARLFDRDRRHVALTEAGTFFLSRARQQLADAARACDTTARIARGDAGALTVGYTPTATYEILPRALPAFRAAWPDVTLELVEMRTGLQADALRAGRIELGLACGPVDAPDLEARTLRTERFVAALPLRHPLAKRRTLRLCDLAAFPSIAVRPEIEPAWADAFARALGRAKLTLSIAQHTDSKLALLGLVAAGLGFGIVSESMRTLARDGVVYRAIADLPLAVPLVALLPRAPSPRAQRFVTTAAANPSRRRHR